MTLTTQLGLNLLKPSTLLLPMAKTVALIIIASSVSSVSFFACSLSLLPDSAIHTIDRGGIAVIPNFLSPKQVSKLRSDAISLYNDGHYIVDALAGYDAKSGTKDKRNFDPTKDRAVLPAYIPSKKQIGPFVDSSLGDSSTRKQFTSNIIGTLRSELATALHRPGLDTPNGAGGDNHEISYTRFGPGAYLSRHIDEHHEEIKGKVGWSRPTRRSLSWLIYLNEEDWNAESDGGELRTYERKVRSSYSVGSRDGDLQLGWLVPTHLDPKERPVFLDGRRNEISGKCALYIDSEDGGRKIYLTREFDADPHLFLTTDFFIQHLLIQNHELGTRFQYLELPHGKLSSPHLGGSASGNGNIPGEQVYDVPPLGGTLVVFDSVALPHEVLPTMTRERWAASGWFHERQQPIQQRSRQIILL